MVKIGYRDEIEKELSEIISENTTLQEIDALFNLPNIDRYYNLQSFIWHYHRNNKDFIELWASRLPCLCSVPSNSVNAGSVLLRKKYGNNQIKKLQCVEYANYSGYTVRYQLIELSNNESFISRHEINGKFFIEYSAPPVPCNLTHYYNPTWGSDSFKIEKPEAEVLIKLKHRDNIDVELSFPTDEFYYSTDIRLLVLPYCYISDLEKVILDKDPRIRLKAIELLREHDSSIVRDLVSKMLASDNPDIRLNGIELLKYIK